MNINSKKINNIYLYICILTPSANNQQETYLYRLTWPHKPIIKIRFKKGCCRNSILKIYSWGIYQVPNWWSIIYMIPRNIWKIPGMVESRISISCTIKF